MNSSRGLPKISPTFSLSRRHHTFVECTMKLICPQEWGKLQVTPRPDVRHCRVCAKDVYYCNDDEDLAAAIKASHCVAYKGQSPEFPKVFELVGEPVGLTYGSPKASKRPVRDAWRRWLRVIGFDLHRHGELPE